MATSSWAARHLEVDMENGDASILDCGWLLEEIFSIFLSDQIPRGACLKG
jgi:hypothetical protein